MQITSYKDLLVWQKALTLVEYVYLFTGKFPVGERYGLVSQMRRAAVSIPSNIAEGSRRKSTAELLQFLRIADGSASELETQMIVAKRLFLGIDLQPAEGLLIEVQKMLGGMMAKLDKKQR